MVSERNAILLGIERRAKPATDWHRFEDDGVCTTVFDRSARCQVANPAYPAELVAEIASLARVTLLARHLDARDEIHAGLESLPKRLNAFEPLFGAKLGRLLAWSQF